jgi:hypothetical protein
MLTLLRSHGPQGEFVLISGTAMANDSLWYKDAIVYQLHVRDISKIALAEPAEELRHLGV